MIMATTEPRFCLLAGQLQISSLGPGRGPDKKMQTCEIDRQTDKRQAVKKGDVGMGWEEEDDDKSGAAKFPQGAVNTRGS